MKKILFIPVICILCASFDSNSSKANGYNQIQSQPSDLEITANIKQMLMDDDSLSSSAKMISVKTKDGVVTLTGNVISKDEKLKVANMVLEVPGVTNVHNQLAVAYPYYGE